MKSSLFIARVFLAVATFLLVPTVGRSQIALTFIASDTTYSQVTVTASGSWANDADPFGLFFTSLSLDGFSSATGLNVSDPLATLNVFPENGFGQVNYDTLIFDNLISSGIYLESSADDTTNGSPYDFSGSATFDLSSLMGQIGASGEIEASFLSSDGITGYTADIGSWTFEVAAVPEPGTVALGSLGVGILAFALRRRRVAA